MSQFEFTLTLFSILIAVIFGRLVSTLSSITSRTADYQHVGWLFVLLLNLLLSYWLFWESRNDATTFAEYVALLTTGGLLIYAVCLLTPSAVQDDWHGYFDGVRARFYMGYGGHFASDTLFEFLLHRDVSANWIPIGLCIFGALVPDKRAQWLTLSLFLLTFTLVYGRLIMQS